MFELGPEQGHEGSWIERFGEIKKYLIAKL